MDDYDQHHEQIEQANLPLLHGFHRYLIDRRTGKKASCDHVDRIAFFANTFLIDYQNKPLAEGYDEVAEYLGYWFIRKAMWSDEKSMKANVATFHKFYEYLFAADHIDSARLLSLKEQLERSAPDWLHSVSRYNDPDFSAEEVWDDLETSAPSQPAPSQPATPDLQASTPASGRHLVVMISALAAKHLKVTIGKLPKTDDFADEGHWCDCWRCDFLASDQDSGSYYFIFTNASTLYSLVIPSTDLKVEPLISFFSRVLHHQCHLLGIRLPADHPGTFSLVRGQPRSLIGSQNEMIRCAIHLFGSPDPSLDGLCNQLNRTPMFAIEDVFPDTAFTKALAADPPVQSPPGDNILPFRGHAED